jgi:hypothetical protein
MIHHQLVFFFKREVIGEVGFDLKNLPDMALPTLTSLRF